MAIGTAIMKVHHLFPSSITVDRVVCVPRSVSSIDKLRIEHLKVINTPTLIVQGESDPLGSNEEVAGYRLSKKI